MARPKGSKNNKGVPTTNTSIAGTPRHKEVPKVEFAPIPPPAPELPPQAGIGPDVDYGALPERQVNMDLLKAGVSDPVLPSTPLSKETTKEISTEPIKENNATDIFTRTPPVRKEQKSMSHSGTTRTTF